MKPPCKNTNPLALLRIVHSRTEICCFSINVDTSGESPYFAGVQSVKIGSGLDHGFHSPVHGNASCSSVKNTPVSTQDFRKFCPECPLIEWQKRRMMSFFRCRSRIQVRLAPDQIRIRPWRGQNFFELADAPHLLQESCTISKREKQVQRASWLSRHSSLLLCAACYLRSIVLSEFHSETFVFVVFFSRIKTIFRWGKHDTSCVLVIQNRESEVGAEASSEKQQTQQQKTHCACVVYLMRLILRRAQPSFNMQARMCNSNRNKFCLVCHKKKIALGLSLIWHIFFFFLWLIFVSWTLEAKSHMSGTTTDKHTGAASEKDGIRKVKLWFLRDQSEKLTTHSYACQVFGAKCLEKRNSNFEEKALTGEKMKRKVLHQNDLSIVLRWPALLHKFLFLVQKPRAVPEICLSWFRLVPVGGGSRAPNFRVLGTIQNDKAAWET